MVQNLILVIFYQMKNYMKIFLFIIFHMRPQQVRNHDALVLIKQMDLLYLFMVKLNISTLIMGCLIKFV